MTPETKQSVENFVREHKEKFQSLYDAHHNDPLDEDGYPTDGALDLIAAWDYNDPRGWFDFIHSIWHLASWGWSEKDSTDRSNRPIRLYEISTAGWSGNESIITAMQDNHILWCTTWYKSVRGGHYTFELQKSYVDE